MRSPRVIAIAVMAVVFAVAVVTLLRLGTRERDAITAVVTPPPVLAGTPVTLKPGQRLCEEDVALEPDSQVIRVYSGAPTSDVARLHITLRGDGWSTSVDSPPVGNPGTGADGIYDTSFAPPPRSLLATVCVSSAEDRPAILAGSREDRVHTRSRTTVDGKPIEERVGMSVLSGGPQAPLSHLKTVLQRAAAFEPAPVGWVLLGLVLVVVGLGVPALVVYATLRALRDD